MLIVGTIFLVLMMGLMVVVTMVMVTPMMAVMLVVFLGLVRDDVRLLDMKLELT